MIDVTPYLEKKYPFLGLVTNPPDHSCDNGLLFTATAHLLGLPINVNPLVWACHNDDWTINRYPGDRTLESWDDLIGIVAAEPKFASLILRAGGFFHYWDNTGTRGFKWSAWLGRFFGFVPFLKIAAGQKIGIFSQVALAFSFLGVLLAKPSDTSGKCLDYLRIRVVYSKYRLVDWIIDHIWWVVVHKQNQGMSGVYSIYFGATHPITLRAKEIGI
jgi:hypothetical protein